MHHITVLFKELSIYAWSTGAPIEKGWGDVSTRRCTERIVIVPLCLGPGELPGVVLAS